MANRDFKKIERIMKDFSLNLGSGESGTMLLDFDKLMEDNPDFDGTIYLDTKGVNAQELFDFVSNGGIVAQKYVEELEVDPVVKIVYSSTIYFDDEITRYVEFDNGGESFAIVLSNKPEPGPEPPADNQAL